MLADVGSDYTKAYLQYNAIRTPSNLSSLAHQSTMCSVLLTAALCDSLPPVLTAQGDRNRPVGGTFLRTSLSTAPRMRKHG